MAPIMGFPPTVLGTAWLRVQNWRGAVFPQLPPHMACQLSKGFGRLGQIPAWAGE